MKLINGLLLILGILFITSCKKEDDSSDNNGNSNNNSTETPTGILKFHLHTFIEDTEVDAYGIEYPTFTGRVLALNKAQLYISGIQLVKLDGTTVDLSYNVLKLFESETLEIGNVPVGNYKSVRFKVGLSATTNALSPLQTSDSIILNKPEMWFGSSAQPEGYVFMNVQGMLDTTAAMTGETVPFVYKIGTNANYVQVNMPETSFSVFEGQIAYVHMVADYSKLFTGIDFTNASNLTVASPDDNSLPVATAIKNNIPLMFRYE